MKYRILLVDDEIDILEFIGYNLTRAGYEVFTAENGEQGLKVAREHHPHLILLDRMMPIMDGRQTCRAIRKDPQLKDTLVVFLSALGEEEEQLKGFGAGADDYLAKPIKIKLLISRIQAMLKRVEINEQPQPQTPQPEAMAKPQQQTGIIIDNERHTVICEGKSISLPKKEFSLLELLVSSPGKLISREKIYNKIWGTEVVVGDRTIDVHIRKLRQKIGNDHIITVKGVGYRYEP